MANVLKMAKIQAIIGLLEQGWSHRRIARELHCDRETVGRYDRLHNSNPAIVTAGAGPPGESNPAIATAGSQSDPNSKPAISTPGSKGALRHQGRASHCEPFREFIVGKLDHGLTAQRIFQDLCSDHDFTGSYSSVKRFVRRIGSTTPLPFRRMECEPGEEAQVDFGTGAWVVDSDGKKRRPHILRVVLSHSRKGYSEPVWRQTTESFIRAIENAFRSFGGVPKTLVIDNLKAAVKKADWFDPELNPKVVEFASHYGTVIMPTKPYTPRHKGKVESGVKYVKDNALKGRIFESLAQQKRHLDHWEQAVADTRIHGTTKRQVRRVFEEVERGALSPLPHQAFPFYLEGRRKVHRDAHVEVNKSYYSVPPEYLGREVWVRWDNRLVRIFNDDLIQIALHTKTRPGSFATDRNHLSDKKISGVERGAEYLLKRTHRIGADAKAWAEAMLEARGIEGVRVLQGFLSLTKKHSPREINRAARVALKANLFSLRPLRTLIAKTTQQPELEFTDTHEIIRPLSEYQRIVNVSFNPDINDEEAIQ